MKKLAIIQARMTSTRLPGKVLRPILGRPMLALQIERIARAEHVDQVLVATSIEVQDNPITELCRQLSVPCFRGSLNDVLDRYHSAIVEFDADIVVRLTGDCPLSDPKLIDRVVSLHLNDNLDYASNIDPPTWPDGLDIEVMKREALECAWREAKTIFEREHVTPFIRNNSNRFTKGNLFNDRDLSLLRWTVDDARDFEFVSRVFEAIYPANPTFGTTEILALLEHEPTLSEINAGTKRNAGSLPPQ